MKRQQWLMGGLAVFLTIGAGPAAAPGAPQQTPPPPPPPTQAPPPPVVELADIPIRALSRIDTERIRADMERAREEMERLRLDPEFQHRMDRLQDELAHQRYELQDRVYEMDIPDFDFDFEMPDFELEMPDFDFEMPEIHMDAIDIGRHLYGGRSSTLAALEMTVVPQGDPAAAPFNEAKTLLFDGRYDEARAKFLEIVKNFPRSEVADDAEFWAAYAQENMRGQTEAAFESYQQFVTKNPNSPFVEHARASMVQLAGKLYKQGMSEYKQYIDTAREGSDDEVKLYALQALAQNDDFDIVSSIEQILADGSASSRLKREAVDLLRRNEDARAVQVLEKAAKENADPYVRRRAIEVLGSKGDRPGYDALVRLYAGEKSVNARRYIADAAGSYRRAGFAAQAADFLARVAETDADDEVRQQALSELAGFENTVAYPRLTGLLQKTTDPDARRLVLSVIARSDDPDRVAILRREASSGDEKVRRTAVSYLARVEGPEALDALIQIANSDAPEDVRMEAISGIGRFEGSKATSALIQIGGQAGSERIRRAAIDRYGNRMEADVLTSLSNLVKSNGEPAIRIEAMDELRNWGAKGVPALEQVALNDEDESMRRRAVETLGRLEDGAGWDSLVKVYKSESSTRIRAGALDYLYRLNEERSLDTLIAAAKSDKDSDVRRHAVQMLGRSDSEKARKALQEILNLPPKGV